MDITESEKAIWGILYKLCDFPSMSFADAIDYMANI